MRTDCGEKTNEVTSKQALALARRAEAQRALKVLIQATKESNNFNAVKKQVQKNNSIDKTKADKTEMCNNCKYCRITY